MRRTTTTALSSLAASVAAVWRSVQPAGGGASPHASADDGDELARPRPQHLPEDAARFGAGRVIVTLPWRDHRLRPYGEAHRDLGEEDGRARITLATEAKRLLSDASGNVCGVKCATPEGEAVQEHGPVAIAIGGFGADFTADSLLSEHRPDLAHLPTTNGDHCTGDSLTMTMAVGGACVGLECVQMHPAGLTHTEEPDAKVKFLAAEALRGVGGGLLDIDGASFRP